MLATILIVGIILMVFFALACLGAKTRDEKTLYGALTLAVFALLLFGACVSIFMT